jgi:hypothetical protein
MAVSKLVEIQFIFQLVMSCDDQRFHINVHGHSKDKELDFQFGTVDPIMNPVTHYGGEAQQLVLNTKYT